MRASCKPLNFELDMSLFFFTTLLLHRRKPAPVPSFRRAALNLYYYCPCNSDIKVYRTLAAALSPLVRLDHLL